MTEGPPNQQGWYDGPIVGVVRRTIAFHSDARGSFGELWRSGWMLGLPRHGAQGAVAQANLSRSDTRVLRGVHVHQRQADLWVVVDGSPFVALVDLRPAIAGTGHPQSATIDASPGDVLYLPAGVAHGFYARDPLTLIYFVTNEYDGSDEHGFAWNDPQVAIPWPDATPVLSPRDASAQSLAELLSRLRPAPGQSTPR